MSEEKREEIEGMKDMEGESEKGVEQGEEKKRKPGRPPRVEGMMKERANSLPIIKAFQKAEKREERRQEEGGEREGMEGFKKSNRVLRLPIKDMREEEMGKSIERKDKEGEGLEMIMKEMRGGFARIQEQIEVLMECKLKIRKEIEELRKMWRDDKVVLEKRISEIEKKVIEKKGTEGLEGEGAEEVNGRVLSLEERMRMLEIDKERERREWRKNNLIIRGLKIKEESKEELRKKVEEIFEVIGVKARIMEVNKIGEINKGGYGMVWVKLENFKDKVEIMKRKGKVKEKTEWIGDDMTKYERKVEWIIKREAEKRKRKGSQVKIGYKKMWVDKEF
ncbi:golgin subfamily A member 6-like protein 22 [Cardiocondyla obscurior]|uniref:golgin subfamily A member 6-like protein 22 n=1 Tax=Cardiocondyla obscurior TaxID=286306 RepID=UPI0039658886